MNLYTFFDKKAHKFGDPSILMSEADDLMVRALKPAFEAGQIPPLMKRYPEDFDLYKIGTLKVESGEVAPELSFVINAGDIVKGDGNGIS